VILSILPVKNNCSGKLERQSQTAHATLPDFT
jgi:hypothetical protein